jgi:hypothetical protein
MNTIAEAYVQMVRAAHTPRPQVGQRVGFLTETASEQFLAEYKRLRDANLIVPSALVPAPIGGGQMLCESVEVEAPVRDDPFLAKMQEIADRTVESMGDEASEADRRFVSELPRAISELAAAHDTTIQELTYELLSPKEDAQEEAEREELLGDVLYEHGVKVFEQVEHEELVDLLEFLDQIPEDRLHVAFDCLSEDQLRALNEFFSDEEDDEDINEETDAAKSLSTHYRGSQSSKPSMALSWQPKSTKRTLKDILRSGYVPGSKGDEMFAALHRVEVTDDPNNGDDVFTGSNVQQYSRSPRYGYKSGEDARNYDLKEKSTPIMDLAIQRSALMGESHTAWGIQVLPGLRRRRAN